MRNIAKFFKDLWAAAYKLAPEERRRTVEAAAWVGASLVAVMLLTAGATAGQVVPAEHPVWEAILQARLVLVRLVFILPMVVLGACLGVSLYQVLENSELGKRLLIWHPDDSVSVQAQKTRNGGTILATLMGACLLGVCLGVLR